MEIVFIRHGQTDLNKSGRIQGSSVNLSLNKEGREYAEEAAKNFDPSEFDAVYVSPLDRAVETAEIFTKGQKKLIPDDRLLEFDYGEWDGELLTEMKKKHPDAIDPWGKVAKNYVDYASNGETHEELNKRCGDFLDEMYKKITAIKPFFYAKVLTRCQDITMMSVLSDNMSMKGRITWLSRHF